MADSSVVSFILFCLRSPVPLEICVLCTFEKKKSWNETVLDGLWESLEASLRRVLREDTALGVSLLLGELNTRLDQEVRVTVEKRNTPSENVEKGSNEDGGSMVQPNTDEEEEGTEEGGWDDAELDIGDEDQEIDPGQRWSKNID